MSVYTSTRTNLFPALRQEFGFHPSGTHVASECHTPGQNHLPEEEHYIRMLSDSKQNRHWSVYTCAGAQKRTHLCSSSGLLIRLKRMCSSWSLSLGSGCRQAVHRMRGINSCGHTHERRSNNMHCTRKLNTLMHPLRRVLKSSDGELRQAGI